MKKARSPNPLIGWAKVGGLDRDGFRRCSGLSPATFNRRMADPDSITLGEFRAMLEAIRVMPDEEVVKFIRRRT